MSQAIGQIDPDILYPLEEFKRVSGMGTCALRTARNAGLRMLQTGHRKYVKGQDFIDYLESVNCNSTTMNA
ncbi:hypothetical protein [Gimesia sp.]|uniref:hypothetical protein n=1 Tax=Gimesia sp. TaxID=2024833 RepID=UPI003A904012